MNHSDNKTKVMNWVVTVNKLYKDGRRIEIDNAERERLKLILEEANKMDSDIACHISKHGSEPWEVTETVPFLEKLIVLLSLIVNSKN